MYGMGDGKSIFIHTSEGTNVFVLSVKMMIIGKKISVMDTKTTALIAGQK